ncbi:MAG TPA: ParB/RepB/Spo0J family partition protein, partial [bacterium]|nr:ParB/RepB/Spo0J family partition protein [bacterium]
MSTTFKEFEEAQRAHGALTTRPLGVIQVPVDEIVGSVGRARYFPHGLRPGRGLTPSRVRRLMEALNHGEVLPPVLLYRLGHEYYIADGHHRVAAAQMAGQQDVDAEVVAFLPEGRTPEDIVARERVLFEQRTGITRIVLHELGQYPKLLRWIDDYRRQR